MDDRAPSWMVPLHEAMEGLVQGYFGREEIVTGFVVLIETASADGDRILRRLHGPMAMPDWQRQGLLHNALYSKEEEWEDLSEDGADGSD